MENRQFAPTFNQRRRRVITPVMCVTINNQRLAFLFRANRIHTGLMHMLIACLHTYHELWSVPMPNYGHVQPAPLLLSVRLEGPENNRRMQRRTIKAVQPYNIADIICTLLQFPLWVKWLLFLDGIVFH